MIKINKKRRGKYYYYYYFHDYYYDYSNNYYHHYYRCWCRRQHKITIAYGYCLQSTCQGQQTNLASTATVNRTTKSQLLPPTFKAPTVGPVWPTLSTSQTLAIFLVSSRAFFVRFNTGTCRGTRLFFFFSEPQR